MLRKAKKIKVWCEGGQLNSNGYYSPENWVNDYKRTRCHKCNKLLTPMIIDDNGFGDKEFIGYRIPPHKKLVKVKG